MNGSHKKVLMAMAIQCECRVRGIVEDESWIEERRGVYIYIYPLKSSFCKILGIAEYIVIHCM